MGGALFPCLKLGTMKTNESNQDRALRTVAALGLLAASRGKNKLLLALAAVLGTTAALGYCPLYQVLGMNTCKK